MIDYTKLLKKISPEDDGQDVLRLRVGVVAAIAADGTVDLTLNGVTVPDVPVLGSAHFAVASTVQVLSYRGSLMIIGSAGGAAAQPVITTGGTANGTVTQLTFTNTLGTTGIHGVAFIAPPSGKVSIIGRAVGGSATAGQYTTLDIEVKTGAVVGSGSVVRSPQEDEASVFQSGTAAQQGSLATTALITGLTPGVVYNAALAYHSTGAPATSSINRRWIGVFPQ